MAKFYNLTAHVNFYVMLGDDSTDEDAKRELDKIVDVTTIEDIIILSIVKREVVNVVTE